MIDLGTDINTPDAADLDPYFAGVSGWRCLAQGLARRLVTPRGSLLDDPAYGYDLRSRLNDVITAADLSQLAGIVKREFEADERVERADATVTYASGALRVAAIITTATGTMRLVVAVSSVTSDLLAAEPL